jgi:hypothetical protein
MEPVVVAVVVAEAPDHPSRVPQGGMEDLGKKIIFRG